jgi:hypothetical protein
VKTLTHTLLCTALLSAMPAFASSIDTFSVTNNATVYSFTLPASPTQNVTSVSNAYSDYFDVSNVLISINGGAAVSGTVYFNTTSQAGGVGIGISTPSTFFNDEGPQLFTYTGTLGQASFAPTFNTGTFTLYQQSNPQLVAGSVTVSPSNASPTPEPSSLALLGTGVLSLAGMVRRKLS